MFKPVDANQNFIEMEKKWLEKWEKDGLVKKYLDKNKNSKENFSFLDGPITANNPMGVHHAWGRTYKDIWQRFHNLLGHKQRFQNGFDCQGLWVEVEVEKEVGIKVKKDIENIVPGDKKASIAKFVQMCKDRVLKYSAIQTEQSKRLAYFMDWGNSYFTMSPENNYMIWHFLKKCFENGWVYKGHESVPWCPRCETAISQHEMLTEDYKELVHESIYLALPIVGRDKEYLLIWTTTPWTIPANIAVTVDAKLEYSLVDNNSGQKYWVAKGAVERVFNGLDKKIIKTVKGKELVSLKYQHPFDVLKEAQALEKKYPDKFHVVIATDNQIMPISAEEGTGLVHTAVSAGVEDFRLGKKYGLPMIPVIADNADYLPTLDFLSGKNAKKHPEIIFDYLKKLEEEKNEHWIFKIERYKHRYPACWRCKTELVWKVADEWYIAMDRPSSSGLRSGKQANRTLRERMVEVAKKIKWMPEFGLDRELDWLKNMHDWLISKKNRYWGLALPIYECKKCHNFEVIGSYDELKKRAVSGWKQFEGKTPHKPFIDEVKIKCNSCGEITSRIDDVGNPWLDAGIVPFSTITKNNQGEPLYLKDKKEWEKWYPADFITESFPGQFKNWFYALIAESAVLEDARPMKTVLGFGTLQGEDGRPMHKSWGNSIEFNEGADKIGVDVMRLMYARQNPADNMLFGYKKADEVRRQFYLILWNSYKFYVEYAILENFDPKKSIVKIGGSNNILDQWIISRLYSTITSSENFLKNYNAQGAVEQLEKLASDLSTWYIRRSRDRVWTNSDNQNDKEQLYSTLHQVFLLLSIVLSTVLPFISEEIYTNLTEKQSVHLETWPEVNAFLINDELEKEMIEARIIVEQIHAKRKEAKIKVRQPLASISVVWKTKISEEVLAIIKDEVNVKEVKFAIGKKDEVGDLDTNITPELEEEGELRDLIRQIQNLRKQSGAKPEQKIGVVIPEKFKKHADFLKHKVLAQTIEFGPELKLQ